MKALLDILDIQSVPTRTKYIRHIRRLDRVELSFHSKQQQKRTRSK